MAYKSDAEREAAINVILDYIAEQRAAWYCKSGYSTVKGGALLHRKLNIPYEAAKRLAGPILTSLAEMGVIEPVGERGSSFNISCNAKLVTCAEVCKHMDSKEKPEFVLIEGLQYILPKEDFETFVEFLFREEIKLEDKKPMIERLFGEEDNNPIFSREQFSSKELSYFLNLFLGAFGDPKFEETFNLVKEGWRRYNARQI